MAFLSLDSWDSHVLHFLGTEHLGTIYIFFLG
jgi:hypothetical protein